MHIFKRLWQRVFVYSFVLVLIAGIAGVFLFKRNLVDEASSVVVAFTGELRNALKGLDESEAAGLLRRFNGQEAKFWLEDETGRFVAGQPFAGQTGKYWQEHLVSVSYAGELALWRTDLEQPFFIAIVPCELQGSKVLLYAAFMPFPAPPLETLLSPGLITLSLITGLLALWIALRVGTPLRRLQNEVSQVSGSPAQLVPVTVTGFDEVADVARAINRLVASLKQHIDGMNQLVVNVSHELRSPITRMGFSLEMIGEALALCKQREHELPEADLTVLRLAETNFAALGQELEYMNKLIGDTLFAGKLAVRETVDLSGSVNFSELCSSLTRRYLPAFRRGGQRFISNIEPDIHILGDETLLTQVLSNLLENAEKYASGPEPQIWLRLFSQADKACLLLENTHPPLPGETLDRLFAQYFRHDQKTGTGVGLGLFIVQKIMLLHGGEIQAENTERGLRFRLLFPLASA